MITEYKWLADTIAYKYYTQYNLSNADLEDLKQEGYICIWKASKTFREYKEGRNFKNYASLIINRELRRVAKSLARKINFEKEGFYEIDTDKEIMLLDIAKALDLIKVGVNGVKSEKGKAYLALKLEGLSEYEIAELCNSHQSNVHRSINLTIKRVKKILNIKECC